jgi:cellulose biosynthesis protein BcsQ
MEENKFLNLLNSFDIKIEIINWVIEQLKDLTVQTPDLHDKIMVVLNGAFQNHIPEQYIIQAATYYREQLLTDLDQQNTSLDSAVNSDEEIKEEEQGIPLVIENPIEDIIKDEETIEQEDVSESDENLKEEDSAKSVLYTDDPKDLYQNITFQSNFNGHRSLSNQAKRIYSEFNKLKIDDIREFHLIRNFADYYTWETVEILDSKRHMYSTVICNQNGSPKNIQLRNGFPDKRGKCIVATDINDFILQGEVYNGYFNFYIFKILNITESVDSNKGVAQCKLIFSSYHEYGLYNLDTEFPQIWIRNPKTNKMFNYINQEIYTNVKNGSYISLSTAILHLVENLTLKNFTMDNDPYYYLSLYGKTLREYKPKSIYSDIWFKSYELGSRIFLYAQLTGPSAYQRGVNCFNNFKEFQDVVFKNWLPEILQYNNNTYSFKVPVFLDVVIQPTPGNKSVTESLQHCLECIETTNINNCSKCEYMKEEDAFITVTFALSTPNLEVITPGVEPPREDLFNPKHIFVRRAGECAMFSRDFQELPAALKTQILPIGSTTWYGLLQSFGNFNNPSPWLIRLKLKS